MGIIRKFFNQTRKPDGILGCLMLHFMNFGHGSLADWSITKLPDIQPNRIAELGCGGGRNISVLLEKYPNSRVDGVDYSALSAEKAVIYNAASIAAQKCTVSVGDVSTLELKENVYDLATAFETIYFWPGLEKCFGNVYKILKDGGRFLIVCESDGCDNTGEKYEKIIDGMKVYNSNQIEDALKKAGFKTAETFHHKKNPWIAVIAQK